MRASKHIFLYSLIFWHKTGHKSLFSIYLYIFIFYLPLILGLRLETNLVDKVSHKTVKLWMKDFSFC